MSLHNVDGIIESIAKVTSHTDRELLEISLVSTLYGLVNADYVAFYRVIQVQHQVILNLAIRIEDHDVWVENSALEPLNVSLDALPGAERVLQTKQAAMLGTAPGNDVFIHPIVDSRDEVAALLVLHCSGDQTAQNEAFILGFLQIFRNYLRLIDQSEHDTLTHLLNRRTFDREFDKLQREEAVITDEGQDASAEQNQRRRCPNGGCHWLAVIDIDFFKRINDQFGHLYGDEVLLLFANIMRETFRSQDKLFRFGGEEFVVILRALGLEDALAALERFRLKVESYPFPQIGQVTASIGFIEIEKRAVLSEVLACADEALYYAKSHGRNQVCDYRRLVESGELAEKNAVVEGDVELF